jgi:hypothetical protein
MFRSIRLRIAVPYVLLTILTMLGLGIYLSNFIRQTYLNNLETQLIGQGRLIADSLANDPQLWEDPENLDRLANHWAGCSARDPGGCGWDCLGDQKKTVFKWIIISIAQKSSRLSNRSRQQHRFSQTIGYQMMYTAISVQEAGRVAGFVASLCLCSGADSPRNYGKSRGDPAGDSLTILLALWIASRTTQPPCINCGSQPYFEWIAQRAD